MDKIGIHKQINEAYAILLRVALRLDLKSEYEDLEASRSFMSEMVDLHKEEI